MGAKNIKKKIFFLKFSKKNDHENKISFFFFVRIDGFKRVRKFCIK